jgi:hypothetical protein
MEVGASGRISGMNVRHYVVTDGRLMITQSQKGDGFSDLSVMRANAGARQTLIGVLYWPGCTFRRTSHFAVCPPADQVRMTRIAPVLKQFWELCKAKPGLAR